jgi:tetratricopeptide (TPR) repeat protein
MGALLACLTIASGRLATGAPAAQPPASRPSGTDAGQNRVIQFLESRVERDPDDITAQNRLSGEYLRRFRKSGDDRDLVLAGKAADQSLRSVPGPQNTSGLAARARAVFALHGFAAARDIGLQLVEFEPDKRLTYEILGDALLELGDYDKAADALRKMEALGDADIGGESRLARLALVRGDNAGAKNRLTSALHLAEMFQPPAPDVRAWCLVQLGQLSFSTGDWDNAEKQYQQALAASPDDWAAIDHLAELRAAQKRYAESVELYRGLIQRVPRPELMQVLGDVCTAMGQPDEARRWHDKALQGYLAASDSGLNHYVHHLAGFYCDSAPNPAEAVKWARKDLEIRHSVFAYDGLAWALYQSGQYKPAAEAMDKALSQGTKSSHLLYHASLIYAVAGPTAKARECLKQAAEANPRFTEFHVHR